MYNARHDLLFYICHYLELPQFVLLREQFVKEDDVEWSEIKYTDGQTFCFVKHVFYYAVPSYRCNYGIQQILVERYLTNSAMDLHQGICSYQGIYIFFLRH